jgi:hypothetical protein
MSGGRVIAGARLESRVNVKGLSISFVKNVTSLVQ